MVPDCIAQKRVLFFVWVLFFFLWGVVFFFVLFFFCFCCFFLFFFFGQGCEQTHSCAGRGLKLGVESAGNN